MSNETRILYYKFWIVLFCFLAIAASAVWAPGVDAYDRYSVNRDATNCRACHGDFRSSPYTSKVDGQSWGDDLHDVHRNTMLSGDCDTCHSGSSRFPVMLNSSSGGSGLAAISCMGCHGRNEDSGHVGAGLRQHHYRAGETVCAGCHSDSNPVSYTPVGENVKPPYYGVSLTAHPNMPIDPCNSDGKENFKGTSIGLNNDGDTLFDGDDPNCQSASTPDIAVTDSVAPDTDLQVPLGSVTVGASSDQTVTVTNAGTANLVIGTVASANPLAAPFSIPSGTDGCSGKTLAPSASCTLTVRFAPAVSGAANDTFDIPSNDPDENPVTVSVSGTGGESIVLSTDSGGGGCSVVGAGGGWKEAAGIYGLIALAWIGLALRRRKPKSGK